MRFASVSVTLLCLGATVGAIGGSASSCSLTGASLSEDLKTVLVDGKCKNDAGQDVGVSHFDVSQCIGANEKGDAVCQKGGNWFKSTGCLLKEATIGQGTGATSAAVIALDWVCSNGPPAQSFDFYNCFSNYNGQLGC